MTAPAATATTLIPLLDTKLHIPAPRRGIVSRPRLVERLRRGAGGRLALVSAPPGFGKTTVLAEWLATAPDTRPAAGWISLDAGDNDPAVFWSYVLAALRTTCPEVGGQSLPLLRATQQHPIETVLTALINELGAGDGDVTLVLDDYHVIDAESIHAGLTFLLDNLPRRVHLVIASRSDPPLPLARLRARGELTEVRVADLRFTPGEASAFLGPGTSTGLAPRDVEALERRTEGWIAGLQLAALSIEGREDRHAFVEAFSGDHRYITDYLVEEVLQRQPEAVRAFLLRTSILDRLSAPLCDAVTGGEDGSALLQELDRRNLFVVPLDDRREWYRYHHLFAEVLQAHLTKGHPEQVGALHRRASAWHRRHGSAADAVRHALAAGEMEEAAELLEVTWPAMDRAHQSATWLGWVRALPDARVRASPVLSAGYAWTLLSQGEMEQAESRLRDAEGALEQAVKDGAISDEIRLLPASIASARAYLAQALGDVPGSIEHARRSLALVAEGDHEARAPAGALLGLAYWTTGELEVAHRTFGGAMDSLVAAGDELSAIGGSFILGDILVAQGRLREAASTYAQSLQRASAHAPPVFPGVGDLYLGLADLHRERGDLEGAARLLESAREAYAQGGHSIAEHRWWVVAARLRISEGDLDGALGLLDEAERVHVRSPLPDVLTAAAMRARVWVPLGKLDEAIAWSREQGLAASGDLSYLREFEHLTFARLLLALPAGAHAGAHAGAGEGHSAPDALALLDRLADAAEGGKRTGSLIGILILQALGLQALGSTARGLRPLERALSLAEPDGFVRTFVDEGEPVRRLLRGAAVAGIGGAYTRTLLAAFDQPRPRQPAPPAGGLAQPLTDRELEVLRLVAVGMRNQEIAGHLSISLATVKRHIANGYRKLDVGVRTAAVARATELKLL